MLGFYFIFRIMKVANSTVFILKVKEERRWENMSNNLSVGLLEYRKLSKVGSHSGIYILDPKKYPV